MCLIVTGIGTLIQSIRSAMAHDAGFARYFAYLNLFLFSC
jgi:NADH:ubiquinone oxidoreductase subunit 5 (subunit L)/multisubunit Na+/H+ antiporter MnhA subunit